MSQVPHNNTATSEAAAEGVAPRAPSQRRKIFNLILGKPSGVSCEEVEDSFRIGSQTASARINELYEAGCVAPSGRTRLTRLGAEETIWVATGMSYRAAPKHIAKPEPEVIGRFVQLVLIGFIGIDRNPEETKHILAWLADEATRKPRRNRKRTIGDPETVARDAEAAKELL